MVRCRLRPISRAIRDESSKRADASWTAARASNVFSSSYSRPLTVRVRDPFHEELSSFANASAVTGDKLITIVQGWNWYLGADVSVVGARRASPAAKLAYIHGPGVATMTQTETMPQLMHDDRFEIKLVSVPHYDFAFNNRGDDAWRSHSGCKSIGQLANAVSGYEGNRSISGLITVPDVGS